MECGDLSSACLDGLEPENQNNTQNTSKNNENTIFEYNEAYDYEVFDGNRPSFEEKIRSSQIIRSTKYANKKVAVLRYKQRQERANKNDEMVSKIIFILGVVGCVSCNTVENASAFAFFAQDFDIMLARQRARIENPTITDSIEIQKIASKEKKRSGSSLKTHLKKCNPSLVKPPDIKPDNQSGTKNCGQFKNKATHILQTKTTAAMMIISAGIPMGFLENPYLPTFCDLRGVGACKSKRKH